MSTLDERIAKIEGILENGISNQSHGSRSTTRDLDQLRLELQRLQRQKNARARGSQLRKVVYVQR